MSCRQPAFGDPLGSGQIKNEPEDFRVTELYDFEPNGEGEHLLLWIEKIGANTGWVANQFASQLGLRHFDVSYCGKKDRHAVTQQWISCWLPGLSEPELSAIEGVTILSRTRHNKKLRRGDHAGNRFDLRVRGLDVEIPNAVDERLEMIREQGFPNYFGPQRFGINNQNLQKAFDLIEVANDRRKLDRKQKDIYVSALRSWIFNAALAKQVQSGNWSTDESLWVHGLSPHRDITLPRLEDEFQQAGEFIERMSIKAHQRKVRVMPENMSWQIDKEDLNIKFDLPNGAYATCLLEQIINIEDAHQ